MGFATASFLPAIEQVADQVAVQRVLTRELRNADTFSIKHRSGLLGCEGGGHSVHSWASVLIWRNYAQKIVSVKDESLKSCASEEGMDVGVGERLREERTRLGLNQETFAQLGGITRNTQGSYEKGERNPDSVYLTAVLRAGVDVPYVLTGRRTLRALEGLNEAEEMLLRQFRTLSDYDQKAVHRIISAMAEVTGLSDTKK
jgi:transcriptional regulator with XRE-family HTH domain